MPQPRTTLVQLLQPYRTAGLRYNAGDVVRLPRRLASTLVANRRARVAIEAQPTGSTVLSLHEASKRGVKPIAMRVPRQTKADGVPETKEVQAQLHEPVIAELADVVEHIDKMGLTELREACLRNGLSTEGRKAQLCERLRTHLSAEES